MIDDVAGIARRLNVDLDELEKMLNEIVAKEVDITLDDLADDSLLFRVLVGVGRDNALTAAREAVARWVSRLR